MTMTPDSPISSLEKPWLRLPPKMSKGGATESPQSFAKFERFRDLPASERTLAVLAQLLGTTEESLQKLSSKHYWQERVAVWDRRQSDARAEANAEELLRDPRAQQPQMFAVWTPKGYDWVYQRFISEDKLKDHEAILARPFENIAVLDRQPDYYEQLKVSL
jgi:hypothetical protein